MDNQRHPDKRLVYLHCSAIFSGANSHVRKPKKISQLLETHKTSIKILTKEFTLPAIATVAKALLEERIFESLPRARLSYPELFQPSETQEAERAASEAEVQRIEAEAAQDVILTSDGEGEDDCLDFEQGKTCTEPERALEDKAKAPDTVRASTIQQRTQSTPHAREDLSIPKLHPVYLPFKTQHNTLKVVQRLLEECCFEFGNTWVPDLMEARKWYVVESVELTQWTQKFLKHAKSLPPSAINPIAGKSTVEVLFGTSILRHSAVHRRPTSAAGIVNMLSAAITFAESLNDSTRARKIASIKLQLEASIEEIVQHQNLLERKLTDQVQEITHRRAELDVLERSSIEEMLARDEKQRAEVGAAFECTLVDFNGVSDSCNWGSAPRVDGTKAESVAGNSIENSGVELVQKADDLKPFGEGQNDQNDNLEGDGLPAPKPKRRKVGGKVSKVLKKTPSTVLSKEVERNEEDTIPSGQDLHANREAPVVDEIPDAEISRAQEHIAHEESQEKNFQNGVWNLAATSSTALEPHHEAKEAAAIEEFCLVAPEKAFPCKEAYVHPMKPHWPELVSLLPEEAAVTGKPLAREGPPKEGKVASEAIQGTEQVIEGLYQAEDQSCKQDDNPTRDADQPYGPVPRSHVTSLHGASAEDSYFLTSPFRPASRSIHRENGPRSPPSPVPSSTMPSVIEAAASQALNRAGHTIALQIIEGNRILRSVVFITACTRAAILKEARAYCMDCLQHGQHFKRLLENGWDLALVELKIDGCDMDMSTYNAEDLSLLTSTAERTGIPNFTLRLSEN